VIKPQDFADLEELAERLLVFQVRYNTTAESFDGTSAASPSTACFNGSPPTNP
jgi:hypothetical protein